MNSQLGESSDVTARELEGLLASGNLDPAKLLAGDWRFHSVFVAPFSPDFAAARQQFLRDGSGPLASSVDQLLRQGVAVSEAAITAKRLFESAQGLCVAVIASDSGITTVPQPFFGHCDAAWLSGAANVVAPQFRDAFAKALTTLPHVAARAWPQTFVSSGTQSGNTRVYWCELAGRCARALGNAPSRTDARIADLGHWAASAVARLAPTDLSVAELATLARCHLVAGERAAACATIARCAAAGGEEVIVELFDALAAMTCTVGGDQAVESWLQSDGLAIAQQLGCVYDVVLARVRMVAASGSGVERLQPAVDALVAANRKLARQALSREPLWQVTAADPGELIDTAMAAECIARSSSFVSKRIEARTIPFHIHGEQLRLPKRALAAWKTVLDQHHILD